MRQLYTQPNGTRRPNKAFGDRRGSRLGVEYYVAPLGITYSTPAIANHFAARGIFNDAPPIERPWLERETHEVLEKCLGGGVVQLVGDLGAGKSTVLFGVRALMREQGMPYVHIDGHFTNNSPQTAAAIRRATEQGLVVMYDAFDHLFMHGRDNLRLGVHRPAQSRAEILPALQAHVAAGGQLIFAHHTNPWFDGHSTPEHKAELDAFAASVRAAEHRVHGRLGTEEEMAQLCMRIAGVEGPDYAQAYVARAAQALNQTACTYRVAKLMLTTVGVGGVRAMDQAVFTQAVATIDQNTRAKMGASPDYELLPDELIVRAG